MSSLWTPDGERPIDPVGGGEPDENALADEMATMRADLIDAPVDVVIANHCYGLFELAAVYLSEQPPLLPQASLAIDALGALIGGLEGRLGDAEEQLRDALSQLRLAYVQIDGARRAGEQAAAGAGVNGGSGAGARSVAATEGSNDTAADG